MNLNGDDIAQLAYLGLLGAAVAGWFISQNRESLNKTLQQAAIWGFLFLGVIALYGLWNDIERTTLDLPEIGETGAIELPRQSDGHFHLPTRVNGYPVTFLIDTGATNIVLNQKDAERSGFDTSSLRYAGRASTANGMVGSARVEIDLAVGPYEFKSISASVNEGELDHSLLGMTFLSQFRIAIAGDVMSLSK